MSDVFYTTSGVCQGFILAPALFCCAIDWLMRHCSGCFGVDVGNFHLTDINYADDAVLFTDDPTKWNYVFRNFEALAGVMGLHSKQKMKAGVRKNGDFYSAMLCMRYMPSCDVRPSVYFFTDIKHFAKDTMSAILFTVCRSTVD